MEVGPQKDREKFTVAIKEAAPEDAGAILRLLYDTWMDTYPNKELGITKEQIQEYFSPKLTEEAVKQYAVGIERSAKNIRTYIAKEGEKIIGVARAVVHKSKNQLQVLYIHPSHQGKGVGGLLYKTVVPFFNTSNDSFVHVATYNKKAIGFYKKLGFTPTGKEWKNEKGGPKIPEMEMKLTSSSSH